MGFRLAVAGVAALLAGLLGCQPTGPGRDADSAYGISGEFVHGGVPPRTEITFGPQDFGIWTPWPRFEWIGTDDDGFVTSFRYLLTTFDEYTTDTGDDSPTRPEVYAWLLADVPEADWSWTTRREAGFAGLAPTAGTPNRYVFAVLATDDRGLEESELSLSNSRIFGVSDEIAGPFLEVCVKTVCVTSQEVPQVESVIADPHVPVTWTWSPGPTGFAAAEFAWAVDGSGWTVVPHPQDHPGVPAGMTWRNPAPGPRTFRVRVTDAIGAETIVDVPLDVVDGSRVRD